ncbi:hypothetical protein ABVK25_007532 [Lepraria finkii]|uniref:Uncharacterized protein n=1 Tax=Lepraria finkii TaxID=1340010 RepID=A0ABR4B2Y7_9LECA
MIYLILHTGRLRAGLKMYECKEVCAHCQYRDHFVYGCKRRQKGLPAISRQERNLVKQSRYLFGQQAPTGSLTGFLRRSGQPPRHPSLPPRPSGPLPPFGPPPPPRFDLSPSGPRHLAYNPPHLASVFSPVPSGFLFPPSGTLHSDSEILGTAAAAPQPSDCWTPYEFKLIRLLSALRRS